MIILVFRTSSYVICIKQHDGIQGIDQLQRVPTAGRVVLASGLKLNSYRRSYDVRRLACLSNLMIRICSLRLKAGLLLSPFNDIPSVQPFHGDNERDQQEEYFKDTPLWTSASRDYISYDDAPAAPCLRFHRESPL